MSAVIRTTSLYPVLGAILGVVLYTGTVFYYGVKHGEATTGEELSTYVASQKALVAEAELKRVAVETELANVNARNAEKLSELRTQYEIDKSNSDAAHFVRMQQLETRERSYRLMSQATESDRRALADTAAELDRTLTEGRQLVGELRQTLVFRDKQLMVIGEQLRAERRDGK